MARFTTNSQPQRRGSTRRPLSAFPRVFTEVCLRIAENGQPVTKECSTPRAAAATRQDFYRFGAALRNEADRNKMNLLLAAIQPQIMIRLDGANIIFALREFADMADAKAMLAEMSPAPPTDVPGVDRMMTPDELREMYKHSEAKDDNK